MPHVISALRPAWAIPGGRVTVHGRLLPVPADGPPHVLIGGHDAHVVLSSHTTLQVAVPDDAETGTVAIRIDELPGDTVYLEVARSLVTGVHQVDSPAYGADGLLYCTVSGGRGMRSPVPLYRVRPDGTREPIAADLGNPTSLACGPDGLLYISSRFEGRVYRLLDGDRVELFATDLGVATGLAFSAEGDLFVGDRSGSILRVTPSRDVEAWAALPASVAAFHLAMGPDRCLYVAAPTLSTADAIYRITPDRLVDEVYRGFGRPQGLAFDASGALYVVDALAGHAGLYRLDVSQSGAEPELVLAAPALVGVAIAPAGGLALASGDTVWWLDCPLKPCR